MDFILPFTPEKAAQPIYKEDRLLLMGSCFAEEIGTKLTEYSFKALVNPHGILFNPLSISTALREYIENKVYSEKDIFHYDGLYRSFHHHGRFSQPDALNVLENINLHITQAHSWLNSANFLLITFGSAFAYTHKSAVVANCHKLPQKEFQKILIPKEEIVSTYLQLINELKNFNPALKIVFTVSPVRYIRDGLAENNRSKGILLDAVHTLNENHTNCFYFPAYEIVTDVLRDYRFFKEDLVHPNDMAIKYVWNCFAESWFAEETGTFMKQKEAELKKLRHRPLR